MKIVEIITEDRNYTKTSGKMNPDHVRALPSAHLVAGTADRIYDLYRLSLKTAQADGKNPPKFDPESWVGRNNTLHPYTQEEADMLKHAYSSVGIAWTDELHPNPKNKSIEAQDTHKTSPVADTSWRKHK